MSWCEYQNLTWSCRQLVYLFLCFCLCACIKAMKMALEVPSLVEVSDRISKNITFVQDIVTTMRLPSHMFTVKSPTEFPESGK